MRTDRTYPGPDGRVAGVLLALALLAVLPGADAVERTRTRGRLLRTDIIRTDRDDGFSCRLAPSSDYRPRILFERVTRLTHHEVKVYEVMMRIQQEGETDATRIEYRLLPGEEMTGEPEVRREIRNLGPAADATFEVDGLTLVTNAEGVAVDADQRLMVPFDDLRTRRQELTVRHPEWGTAVLVLTRELVVRPEALGQDMDRVAFVQQDLLVAQGLDFRSKRVAGRDDNVIEVEAPDVVTPGDVLEVRLTVRNDGQKPVSSLMGRAFSRHAWLDGRNLYIGAVEPGESRSYVRVLPVPPDVAPGRIYLAVGIWDILGARPGDRRDVQIDIVAE